MSTGVMVAAGCSALALLAALQPPDACQRLIAVAMPARKAQASKRGEQASRRARRLASLGTAGALGLWLSAGVQATVAILSVVAVVSALSLRASARRREREVRAAVAEFCRSISAELRSGRVANIAVRAAADVAPEPLRAALRPVVEMASGGDPHDLADALAVAGSSHAATQGLQQLAACWRVVASSGAMLAPAIDRIAESLQDHIELDRALGTALAAPRATVRLLAVLPVVGLLLAVAIGANPFEFLFGSPGGVLCAAVAAAFDGAGVLWARRIACRAARIG